MDKGITEGCSKYTGTIGDVYRHPRYKVNHFTEKSDNIFTQIIKSNSLLPALLLVM